MRVGDVDVLLKVNRRARRVSVRLDAKGRVTAVAPSAARLNEAAEFARLRADWIQTRLAVRPPAQSLKPGGSVPVRGRPLRLVAAGDASAARIVERDGETVILAGGTGEAFQRRVLRRLRAEALADFQACVKRHAARIGFDAVTVAVADPRSRWGSCTPARASIRGSWRLILAPPDILDYVAAHEVAHLRHPDHSDRFWALVRDLFGDPGPARAWLRANGARLHAVGAVPAS